MKVAVIGAGAIGSYFGGKLALAGNEVTFLARGRQYDALSDTGLTLVTDHDRIKVTGIRVVPHIRDLTAPDAVLVTVKGWDTEQVARDLATAPSRKAPSCPFRTGCPPARHWAPTFRTRACSAALPRSTSTPQSTPPPK